MHKDTNNGARESFIAGVRNLKVIALDCDGVLFDSREANTHFYTHIMGVIGRPPIERTSRNTYTCTLSASLSFT